MTHEFKNIVDQALANQLKGLKSVLATVVALEGSSYRKPGVRMLISEDMKMTGAVSGGCVEAEVRRRAKSVFHDGKSKMMTYDGRYRLGCEGILYILLEPFFVSADFRTIFSSIIQNRQSFKIRSYFEKVDEHIGNFGSFLEVNKQHVTFSKTFIKNEKGNSDFFEQILVPNLRLLLIGGEHDAVKLCQMAGILGWQVEVTTSIKDPKTLQDFPGAAAVVGSTPELLQLHIDQETVIVLMTHNYALDLKYLVKLADYTPKYLGVLGSKKRREQLQNELLNYKPDLHEEFLDAMYSPAGIDIGAVTPEEIALSILSEILAVVREKETNSLRTLKGKIHS